MAYVPYPGEPQRSNEPGSADVPSPVATCPSCRRSVTPRRGDLGASCPLCGGFLPRAKLPPASRRPSSSSESRAEVAGEVAEQLLEEYRPHVRTVAELAALHQAATNAIAEATEHDLLVAERREAARHWREELPDVARPVA
jgi:predicted RNA-binding Zn-ribbon protein involved in translation (DUF1610 family)